MKHTLQRLSGIVLAVLCLSGCARQTTVYLVPDTPSGPATSPSTFPTESSVLTQTLPATTAGDTAPAETVPVTTSGDTPPVSTPSPKQPSQSGPSETVPPTSPPETEISQTEAPEISPIPDILDAVNRCRRDAGLSPLCQDGALDALAACRARECAVSWGHTRPDGRDWSSILIDAGYPDAGGENLLYCQGTWAGAELADSWMASPNHRQVFLDPAFAQIGLACFRQGDTVYLVALLIPG